MTAGSWAMLFHRPAVDPRERAHHQRQMQVILIVFANISHISFLWWHHLTHSVCKCVSAPCACGSRISQVGCAAPQILFFFESLHARR